MDNSINGMNELLVKMRAMAAQAQAQPGPAAAAAKPDFSAMLKQSVDSVNATQQQASNLAAAFDRGDPNVQLAQVMVAMQKANISFQAMTQVRNKLVDAYKDIMNMPI